MNKTIRIILLLFLALAIAWPGVAYAKDLYEDKVVFGGVYRLESGETLNGNLAVFGGLATLEPDSLVQGNVVLFGGKLEVGGVVDGDIIGFGGFVELTETAEVTGDVITIGANMDQAIGADVMGELMDGISDPLSFSFPGGVRVPRLGFQFSPLFEFLWFFFRLFLWAVVAVIVVLFLPNQAERTARTAVSQPVVSGGLGLLTVVILSMVIIVFAITICLIPASLLLALAWAISWGFGLIALGLEVGKRIGGLFDKEWAPGVSAGVGTFALILVLNGLDVLIPCVGWIFPAVAGMLGLGAVILTRFGTQDYPLAPPMQPVTVAPQVAPVPPPLEMQEEEVSDLPTDEVMED